MEQLTVLTFVIIVFFEAVISSQWNLFYFGIGIPVYIKVYRYHGTADTPVGEPALNEAFKGSKPALQFKEIAPDIFAFREKMFEYHFFSYTPLMHGRLEICRDEKEIRIVGLLNWWIIAFVTTLLSGQGEKFEFFSFLVLLIACLYLLQKVKYDKVGQFVYEWNSRRWSHK